MIRDELQAEIINVIAPYSNNKDVTLAAVYMAKIKARRKRKSKEDEK